MVGVIADSILPQLIVALAFNRLQRNCTRCPSELLRFMSLNHISLHYSVVAILASLIWQTQAQSAWVYIIKAEQKIMEHIFRHIEYMDNKFHSDRFGGALVSQANKFVGAYDTLNPTPLTGIF